MTGLAPVTRTGYIGIGTMGGPIAANAIAAGFDMIVYDVRPEAMGELQELGAKTARSPGDVGAHAQVVELSVVDDAQVLEVVLGPGGVLETAQPGTIIAVHSTIHPSTVHQIAEVSRPRGVEVLDAQVSGGSQGARQKTLAYMVGGDRVAFDQCRPVFESSGTNIFYMGGLGMGCATKIAQQVMTCINMLAANEGFSIARAAGIDEDAFQQLVRVSSAQSGMADRWLERTWSPHMMDLFYLGLKPALELGYDLKLPLPGTAVAQQFIRGFGKDGDGGIV